MYERVADATRSRRINALRDFDGAPSFRRLVALGDEMAEQTEAGLKFSLRLSGDMAEQARQLAKARRSTPYRVVKDVLATALPVALAQPAEPVVTTETLAAQLQEQRKVIDRLTRSLQTSTDFTAETLMLLRRISEELSSARDLAGKQALWHSVNKQIQAMREERKGSAS